MLVEKLINIWQMKIYTYLKFTYFPFSLAMELKVVIMLRNEKINDVKLVTNNLQCKCDSLGESFVSFLFERFH